MQTRLYARLLRRSIDYLCYTDGSCKSGAGAPGGWGFTIKPPTGSAIEGYGNAIGTLAKIMEVRAVAEAVACLPEGVSAIVFSDNQSLIENLSRHLDNWRSSDFANVDPLIVGSARIIAACITEKRLALRFQWVRAHNGNVGNERADELATKGAREAKASLKNKETRSR